MQSDRARLSELAAWHAKQARDNLAAARASRRRKKATLHHLGLSDHHHEAALLLLRIAKTASDQPATFKTEVTEQRVVCGNVHPEVGVCNRQAGHDGVHHYVSPRGLHAGIRRRA